MISRTVAIPESLSALHDVFEFGTSSPIPHITLEGVGKIAAAGFGKIGFGISIEDPLGRVLVIEHKAKARNGVREGDHGIPSETVKGIVDAGKLFRVETYLSCLVRCLEEEQGVPIRDAPSDAALLLTRIEPFVAIDWVMHANGREPVEQLPNTFGFMASLKANMPMARHIALNARETLEAKGGFFKPPLAIDTVIRNGQIRPSFDIWFREHLLRYPEQPSELWQELEIPTILDTEVEAEKWRGLRFTEGSLVAS